MTNDEVYGPVSYCDDPFTAVDSRIPPADLAFDEADAMFMMEEEAAEIALRSKTRYAKRRPEQRQ